MTAVGEARGYSALRCHHVSNCSAKVVGQRLHKKTTFCLSLNFLVSKSFSYKKHGCLNNTRLVLTYSGNSAPPPLMFPENPLLLGFDILRSHIVLPHKVPVPFSLQAHSVFQCIAFVTSHGKAVGYSDAPFTCMHECF